jgi:hypothetical protein
MPTVRGSGPAPSLTPTQARDQAAQLAGVDAPTALALARSIADPWFRCQALAAVADESASPADKDRLIAEAFQAALELGDSNRIVTVSAWPLKALCRSGAHDALAAEAGRLLALAAGIPSPVRRADALDQVLGACLEGPRALFWQVFEHLEQACLARTTDGKRNTKGEAILAHWVLVVDRFDAARGQQLLEAIEGPTLRQRARASLVEHKDTPVERWCQWPNLGSKGPPRGPEGSK